jgi:pimeloyl-ACP methyl ester carboxylesterase
MSSYPSLPRNQIDALGIHTNYYTAGSPDSPHPPLVLLHGMSTSADSFRELMHELAGTFYLVAPDIPGFGFSASTEPFTMPHLVEWLAAFLEALNLRPLNILGHSFGGVLAPAYALDYPADVQRLVLLAPAILSGDNYPDWAKKVGVRLGLLDLGTLFSRIFLQRQIRVPFYDASRQDETVWQRRLDDYAQARSSLAVLKATAFYQLRPYLPRLHQPTCLIWGQNDAVVRPQNADELAALLPAAVRHTLDECGHIPMLEQPEEVVRIIQRFLGA